MINGALTMILTSFVVAAFAIPVPGASISTGKAPIELSEGHVQAGNKAPSVSHNQASISAEEQRRRWEIQRWEASRVARTERQRMKRWEGRDAARKAKAAQIQDKEFKLRITDIPSRQTVEYNPAKHIFHPEDHKPEKIDQLLNEITKKAMAKEISQEDYAKEMQHGRRVLQRGVQKMQEGHAIIDTDNKYVYSHDDTDSNEAIEKILNGSAHQVVKTADGNSHIVGPKTVDRLKQRREANRQIRKKNTRRERESLRLRASAGRQQADNAQQESQAAGPSAQNNIQ